MKLRNRIRAFNATLVDVFTSRLDLATAEFEDLCSRVGSMLTMLLAAALTAALGILFLGLAVILAVPDAYRWIPALAFGVIFFCSGIVVAFQLRHYLRDQPPPFASTRDVLHRDAAALRPILQEAAAETAADSEEREPASSIS